MSKNQLHEMASAIASTGAEKQESGRPTRRTAMRQSTAYSKYDGLWRFVTPLSRQGDAASNGYHFPRAAWTAPGRLRLIFISSDIVSRKFWNGNIAVIHLNTDAIPCFKNDISIVNRARIYGRAV